MAKSIVFKVLKITLRVFLFLALFTCTYFICYLIGSNCTVNNQVENDTPVEIFISSNGVHTDLIFPVRNDVIHWDTLFPAYTFKAVDSNFRYIAMGWGDKGFYLETPTWADLKASTALKAMFFLGTSAMHITYHKDILFEENIKSIKISATQYQKLIGFYKMAFQVDDYKPLLIAGKGYTNFDNFYEANGKYSLFNTCNVFTNNALKEASIRAPLWSPMASGLIKHY